MDWKLSLTPYMMLLLLPATNDGLVDDLALKITNSGGGSAGSQAVAENISQLEFRYLDSNGEITATLGDIRSIFGCYSGHCQ